MARATRPIVSTRSPEPPTRSVAVVMALSLPGRSGTHADAGCGRINHDLSPVDAGTFRLQSSSPAVWGRREVGMRVLGLSFSGHGSAACLVEDGRVVHAVNLERLTRVKFALATLPEHRKRVARVLKNAFGFDEPPPIADFYEVFPMLLEAVTGHRDLQSARIDLVVKTQRPHPPGREGPDEPYERVRRVLRRHADCTSTSSTTSATPTRRTWQPVRRRRRADRRRPRREPRAPRRQAPSR